MPLNIIFLPMFLPYTESLLVLPNIGIYREQTRGFTGQKRSKSFYPIAIVEDIVINEVVFRVSCCSVYRVSVTIKFNLIGYMCIKFFCFLYIDANTFCSHLNYQ